MHTRYLTLFSLLVLFLVQISAQSPFSWPDGKKAALSLTFDDARLSHVDVGLELFRELDIDVTFYVVPPNMKDRLEGWKELAAEGHEMGNHTMHHPCTGNFDWVNYPIENYSVSSMRKELITANQEIERMLGIAPATFAYTCGNTFVGRGANQKSLIPLINELFAAGRGWLNESANNPMFVDLAHTQGVEMDGAHFQEDIKPRLEQAKTSGSWLVLAGHEIGDSGHQTTRVDMLRELVEYVKNPENGIWLAPVDQIALYIQEQRRLMQAPLKEAMTFCTTFDEKPAADYANGDAQIYSAPNYAEKKAGTAQFLPYEVSIAPETGKYGHALEFKRKGEPVVYYVAKNNLDYENESWSGTVSLWLKLDPEKDLAPGFTDPIQITDSGYDDAALWVDFSDKNPRDFRLGIFGDKSVWNPDDIGPNKNPDFNNRLIKAEMPAFSRDQWTHVAFTFQNLNSDHGKATLYINGETQGESQIDDPFTWEIDQVKIFLGLNFVGLMDEVAIFNKAFTQREIIALFQLPEGLKSLLE